MTEGRVDDCWRKVFNESDEAMDMKNGEDVVGEQIKSKAKRGNRGFGGQKALGLDETMKEMD